MIVSLILANIGVLKFNVNSTYLLMALGAGIAVYRGITAEKFKDVFNTYPFIFKFKRKENMLELLEAVLMALIVFSDEIIKKQFGLFELIFLIICTLIIYRLLFYNLSKRSNNSNI